MLVIFPKKRFFDLLSSSVRFFGTSTTLTEAARGKKKKTQFCEIMELNINKEILKSNLDQGYLNKAVRITLRKNILVPKVSLLCGFTRIRRGFMSLDFTTKRVRDQLPSQMKVGSFTPKEKFLIKENTDALLCDLKANENRNEVFTDFFVNDENEYHGEKVHILGLYFAQGMESIRLPCEVFQVAKRLHISTKAEFTQEEDDAIIQYMENEGATSDSPKADLSRKLNRSYASVQSRYKDIIKHKDKASNGMRYTVEEDEQIMKAVFNYHGNDLTQIKSRYSDVFQQLGEKLNKRPFNVYCHCKNFILPNLKKYEAGVLDVDFKKLLIDYCVDNNIKYAQEANWQEIVKNPRFKGTTASDLSYLYKTLRGATITKLRKAIPDIGDHEVTSETMQKYLQEKKLYGARGRKDIEDLIFKYEQLKRNM